MPSTKTQLPTPLFQPPPICQEKGCPGKSSLCQHDADIAAGIRDPYTRRPRTCLNRHDPKEGRIPF